MMTVQITQADVLDWLAPMPNNSKTACFCDPPYGLSFMGKQWDHGVPSVDVWRDVLRVLKPGGLLLAFGGTRTWHRLAVNIEDAGFELFDTYMWLYGSGFPKSHNIGKAIDKEAGAEREVVGTVRKLASAANTHEGWERPWAYENGEPKRTMDITAPATPLAATWDGYGTALKPAWEPCLLFRKPRRGTYAQTAVEHGTGALWVDGGRVGTDVVGWGGGAAGGNTWNEGNCGLAKGGDARPVEGRWPANLGLVHDERCNGDCHPDCPARMLGEQSGVSVSVASMRGAGGGGDKVQQLNARLNSLRGHSDTGTAARFFYQAKASRSEREAGLEGMEEKRSEYRPNDPDENTIQTRLHGSRTARNHHPTVKPLAVCEYMTRLILPPAEYRDEAVLLVPYAGSGSEMIGAWQAGWRNVEGCELETEYVEIAERRIAHWCKVQQEATRAAPTMPQGEVPDDAVLQLSLLDNFGVHNG